MSTKEEISAIDHNALRRRVSALDVTPSVARMITDATGNLDEKKAVAELSQTRTQNKNLWFYGSILVGMVFVLIAANIGTSLAVARLTRQLNVNPVTGMATISGSDDVVMKTSAAIYKDKDISFHTVSIDYLSSLKTIEFIDGNISFDVKGYARMSNKTILLVQGGSLIFDIDGLKNVTGDELLSSFSSFDEFAKSIDLDGRRLYTICGLLGFSDGTATAPAYITSPAGPPPPQRNVNCIACGDYPEAHKIAQGWPTELDIHPCCINGMFAGDMCLCYGSPQEQVDYAVMGISF